MSLSAATHTSLGSVGVDEFEVIGGYEFRNWESNQCESVTIQYPNYQTENWKINWTIGKV